MKVSYDVDQAAKGNPGKAGESVDDRKRDIVVTNLFS
jgi:hypothetical protein